MSERNFLQILGDLGNGAVVEKATRRLKRLAKICERTHQSGELVIRLKLRPQKNGNLMTITSHVTIKEPAGEPIESGLFADLDGNLTKTDPTDMFSNGKSSDGKVTRIGMANGPAERVNTNTEVND